MRSSTALIFSAALLGLAAAAAAGETRVDAFGRKVDIGAAFREEMSARIAAKTGSPIWSPLAIRILELEGKALARAEGAGEIDLLCIADYRKKHPEQSVEQYLAFIATPDGPPRKKACVLEQLSGPQLDPKLVDALSATVEVGMMMPMLVGAIRKVKAEKGLPDTPELTPDMEAKVPAMAEKAFSMAGCLMREILKQKPISTIVSDPAALQPIARELVQPAPAAWPQLRGRRPGRTLSLRRPMLFHSNC